jgi:hypothetical protein
MTGILFCFATMYCHHSFSFHFMCDVKYVYMNFVSVKRGPSQDHLVVEVQFHVPCMCVAYLPKQRWK